MKKVLLLFCSLWLSYLTVNVQAQENTATTCHMQVSVLTCAPGNELYALFGHTALRIVDTITGMDVVYNYGTFDFNDPNFYTKFVRGKLDYYLNPESYVNFLAIYQYENRSVTEQVLQLSCEEKLALYDALNHNLLPANKYYHYDFLLDNCTTRIRDLIVKYTKGLTIQQPLVPVGTTYRNMLHQYLDAGKQPWSKFGIDLLLGMPCDKVVDINESQFLPDYLLKAVDASSNRLVQVKQQTFTARLASETSTTIPPLWVTGILFGLLVLSAFSKKTSVQRFITTLYSLLLYLLGVVGVLLLFMWLGTDHQTCRNNLNILWAWPWHIVAAWAVVKQPKWWQRYQYFQAIAMALLLASWWWLPQQLPLPVVPLVIWLSVMGWVNSRNRK
ncbi:MAG TPA: hypothetical protein DCL43_03670 [Chitinophagaceae bacterium]|nr:hypothetical protein [Chitinophagaceae bacterium]HAN38380.1 hypothetical protein [Chitinophagaceae bacterium]